MPMLWETTIHRCLPTRVLLPAALCKMRRFRDAWRAYGAVKLAGTILQYNSYQALISAALKVRACTATSQWQPVLAHAARATWVC